MKKIVNKLFKIVIIFLLLINMFAIGNKCYAAGMKDVTEWANEWTPTLTDDGIEDKVAVIASLVRTVGILASLITLTIIGIKFMLGSVEDKAQYKQTMVPWLIGAIMAFAMATIPTIIYDVATDLFK